MFINLAEVVPGVADGIATVTRVFILILSLGVLNKTSSHICGRCHLPIFLLRDRLLTLMYIDSFMVMVVTRMIKELIYIRVNNPSLNNSIGKYREICQIFTFRNLSIGIILVSVKLKSIIKNARSHTIIRMAERWIRWIRI